MKCPFQHTLFIADLHLDEKHSQSTEFFCHFIEKKAVHAEALYILGDFFEYWIGDDEDSPFIRKIKHSLKFLTAQQIPVYFLRGNRDFLIGRRFARETGCQILPDFCVIKLYGTDILLLHGDALCTLDIKHMKFRKLTQNQILRTLFLTLPLTLRQKIGQKLRQKSRRHHTDMNHNYLNIVADTVTQLLQEKKVERMIHGHIHQADLFQFLIDDKPAERIVLGSWEHHGCTLKWYANGKREMIFFKDKADA